MAEGNGDGPRFAGVTAVVIGGASGLGLGAAERMATEGARVVIGGRRADLADEVGQRLGAWGAACDITNEESLAAFVKQVVEREGSIGVGINCAGFAESVELAELGREKLEPMVAVQFTGAISAMRHLCNVMASNGGGAYLSVSSLTAHAPAAGQLAYGASKAGLEYATRVAALEFGPKQVRVNCVAPSLVETPMTAGFFTMDLVVEGFKQQTPLGRMGTVDDIVGPMTFLVSDEARFVTGQTLVVDGGGSTQKLPTNADFATLAQLQPHLLG